MRTSNVSGNAVIDTILAAVKHYKKGGRRVSLVTLAPSRWRLFVDGLKRLAPEKDIDGDEVEFNDLKVRKGSVFMTEQYDFKLKQIKANA